MIENPAPKSRKKGKGDDLAKMVYRLEQLNAKRHKEGKSPLSYGTYAAAKAGFIKIEGVTDDSK